MDAIGLRTSLPSIHYATEEERQNFSWAILVRAEPFAGESQAIQTCGLGWDCIECPLVTLLEPDQRSDALAVSVRGLICRGIDC